MARWMIAGVGILAIAGILATAQGTPEISAKEMMAHVEKRVPLVYPPIAKAARVTGTVVLQVEVSPAGTVGAVRVVSGPAMLHQTAIDCVRKWVFKPFEKDGVTVAVTGKVSLVFNLAPSVTGSGLQSSPPPSSLTQTVEVRAEGLPVDAAEEAISQRYFKQFDLCAKGLAAATRDETTGQDCKAAADIAAEFAPDRRFIEKRSSAVYAATALTYCGKSADALVYANRAIEVVKLGHDDNSGSSAAYYTRGLVEARMENWAAADADLVMAEEFQRKGVVWAEGLTDEGSFATRYRQTLANDLRFHATVLLQLDRQADAQAKMVEAGELDRKH